MGLSARLAIIPCLLTAGMAPRAQAAGTASLSGLLTDAAGRPVPGAALRLLSTALPSDRLMVTDDRGAFRFVLLLPGSYAVQVSKEGFQPLKASFIVREGREQKVHLTLAAQAPRAADRTG